MYRTASRFPLCSSSIVTVMAAEGLSTYAALDGRDTVTTGLQVVSTATTVPLFNVTFAVTVIAPRLSVQTLFGTQASRVIVLASDFVQNCLALQGPP